MFKQFFWGSCMRLLVVPMWSTYKFLQNLRQHSSGLWICFDKSSLLFASYAPGQVVTAVNSSIPPNRSQVPNTAQSSLTHSACITLLLLYVICIFFFPSKCVHLWSVIHKSTWVYLIHLISLHGIIVKVSSSPIISFLAAAPLIAPSSW